MTGQAQTPTNASDLYQPVEAQPVLGLVIHEYASAAEAQPLGGPRRLGSNVITTLHGIECDDNGTPVFGPGRPLSPDEHARVVERLARGAGEGVRQGTYLAGDLLYATAESAVWYVPARRRHMHLRVTPDETGTCVLEVTWPALVLCARRQSLFVAAVAGNRRPEPDTPLYHAPLGNIGATGAMCAGQAQLPREGHPVESRQRWEAALFDTAFSHVNHDRAVAHGRGTSADLVAFWHARAHDGRRPRAKDMVAMGMTLQEWFEHITDEEVDQ